jgi:tripartite-type tricarboxylate transporter receptor subunit TctC
MRDIVQMKLLVALAATMLALSSQANAQKFPDRPMTMIIPFAAGRTNRHTGSRRGGAYE